MTTETWQSVGIILVMAAMVGAALVLAYKKANKDQGLDSSLPPLSPRKRDDSGFGCAIIGGLLWVALMIVIVLTVLRLGWKVFQFAWS